MIQKIIKTFDCGCEWEIAINEEGTVVGVNYEPNKAPLNCPKVWELLATGKTKGVFQLETPLGQSTSKQCRPCSLEELSDVISVIRPGAGDAELDGKTLKKRYIDRKNGEEDPVPPHPLLKEILQDTQGIFLYQEQAMEASKALAGFSGVEADLLRKACGKKIPKLMAELKEKFISGCQTKSGLSKKEAEDLFSILEAGQRYSFNASHGVSYAKDAYVYTAYVKAHFPRMFFLSELEFARSTIKSTVTEARGEIIDDARNFNVEIKGPDLRLRNTKFELIGTTIHYGLCRIKGVGESKFEGLLDCIGDRRIQDMTWNELMYCLDGIASDAANNLIKAGALDFTHLTRSKMLFTLGIFRKLTSKQKEFVKDHPDMLEAINWMLQQPTGRGQMCANTRSVTKLISLKTELENPPVSFRESKARIFRWETELLGSSFTCTEVDGEEIGNCTCEEYLQNTKLDKYLIAGIITKVKKYITKGKQPGQEMAFVEFKDGTQKIDAVMFPGQWIDYQRVAYPGNKCLFTGERGKNSSFIIKKVAQL